MVISSNIKVGILMPNKNVNNRNIVLHYRDGGLHRISESQTGYNPLQCLLVFSHGIDGWYKKIQMVNFSMICLSSGCMVVLEHYCSCDGLLQWNLS